VKGKARRRRKREDIKNKEIEAHFFSDHILIFIHRAMNSKTEGRGEANGKRKKRKGGGGGRKLLEHALSILPLTFSQKGRGINFEGGEGEKGEKSSEGGGLGRDRIQTHRSSERNFLRETQDGEGERMAKRGGKRRERVLLIALV